MKLFVIKGFRCYFVFLFFILIGNNEIQAKEVEATISLLELFNPNISLENGIKGTVNSGGRIDVKIYDKTTNTLVYQTFITSTSTQFTGQSIDYSKAQLGAGATYYPNTWNSKDIKTALGSIDRKRYDSSTTRPYPMFTSNVDLKIQITETNATMNVCKVPGLGLIDRNGGNALFDPAHYCYNLKNAASFPTRAWMRMKQPRMDLNADFSIATHRGAWGDNLGAGLPENSIAAIAATKKYTDILESDVMTTKDKRLVISHDYNLKRLSDYSGSDRDYLFDMNLSQIVNLHLRKKNMEVSEYKYLTFEDLVDALVKYQLVLTVDIKDVRARYNKDGTCMDNCDYDTKTHGDIAKKKIKDSFMEILRECIRIAMRKNALEYLAFKVNYSYQEIREYISADTLAKTLFMPIVHPTRTDYLEYIDAWITQGDKKVVAYQTNFRRTGDRYLSPFDRGGVRYQNLLHYVYAKTGLRPGIYPEEPAGPKGVANRFGEWLMKDAYADMRGDHYFLMSIPYGKIMVLTTDRPDICLRVNQIYNSMPANTTSP